MTREDREQHHGLHRPTIDDFIFEGESLPLLLRRRVLAGIVTLFLVLVGGYFLAAELAGLSYDIDAEGFQGWVEDFGIWGPLAFMGALAISVLFAPIPNAPIFIAAGLAWGPVLGTAYSMAGMMLGSTMAFYVSRFAGRRHLTRLVGGRMAARLDELVAVMGGRVVFWARMLPVVNFDWISFIAGLTAIRFRTFFLFSFIGMLTPTAVGVIAGDSLGKDIRVTFAIGGVWLAAIVASAVYFWVRGRRWRARRVAERASGGDAAPEFGKQA